jgi:hypothetical protein
VPAQSTHGETENCYWKYVKQQSHIGQTIWVSPGKRDPDGNTSDQISSAERDAQAAHSNSIVSARCILAHHQNHALAVAGEVKNYVPVTAAILRNPDPADWLMIRRT